MTWIRIDDDFGDHPKVLAAGNTATGAFVRMLSYCGRHLTDGHVAAEAAAIYATPKILAKLEEVGLIAANGAGWLIPDFTDFNPTKTEVEEMRRKRREAGRAGGIASGKSRRSKG